MPHYQVAYKLHLPKDAPWRDENRNAHRVAVAQSPDDLFKVAIKDMAEMLSMTDDNVVCGLLLNVVQSFPKHARRVIADAIIAGKGMSIEESFDKKSVIAKFSDEHPPLTSPKRAPKSRDIDAHFTESGLLIPDGLGEGGPIV